jgi:hypothetical protein
MNTQIATKPALANVTVADGPIVKHAAGHCVRGAAENWKVPVDVLFRVGDRCDSGQFVANFI